MFRKLAFSLVLVLVIFPLVAVHIHAKRTLPQAKPASGTKTPTSASSSRGVGTSVAFRGDRRAIIITFSRLDVASSVSYELSYSTLGIKQGAGGVIKPGAEDPTTRELLFGTCSGGICRYDTAITNARLLITTTLKNGVKIVKPYRLRV